LAAKIYGDRDNRLDFSERRVWYGNMGVYGANRPTIKELDEFISLNEGGKNCLDGMFAN